MPKNNNYADNMYYWLKRKGYAKKYEHAGIYCIKLDGNIVYIGKSHNMLKRVAQHYAGIQIGKEEKYRILKDAQMQGHSVSFDVVYYAKERYYHAIAEEIGKAEGEYIRHYMPALNTQIPKAEDWKKYEVKEIELHKLL